MDLLHLILTSSDDFPIKIKSPLKNLEEALDIPSGCNYLMNYQSSRQNEEEEWHKVEHWWKRKWQVSLDYYLASSTEKITVNTLECAASSEQKIDIILSKEVPDEYPALFALLNRKTYRKFQDTPLSFLKFSALLRVLKDEIFSGIWNYYVVVFNVENILPGIYRYFAKEHGLAALKKGLFRTDAVKLLCGMSASLTASYLIVLTIDLQKAMQKYPYNRALREIYVDSGRLAQKLLLKGMQNSIGGLPSPAKKDSQMCSFLNIDPSLSIPIYTVTMGLIPAISSSVTKS